MPSRVSRTAGPAAAAILATVGFAPFASAPLAMADDLAALRWKARPLVILADRADDGRVTAQRATLDRKAAGLRERAIAVLDETDPRGTLHRRLGVAGFAVVLVGKDGDVKKVWRAPVEPGRIFALIDAMPMRREEMKR